MMLGKRRVRQENLFGAVRRRAVGSEATAIQVAMAANVRMVPEQISGTIVAFMITRLPPQLQPILDTVDMLAQRPGIHE